LYNILYFGPGIEAEIKNWHGDLWAEFPLFGKDKIIINQGTNITRLLVIVKDVNGPKSVRANLSKLPSFEMIFFKKNINKISFQVIFTIDYLLAIRDRTSTKVKKFSSLNRSYVGPSTDRDRS